MKAVNDWLTRVLVASLLAGSVVVVEGTTAIAAQSAAQNDYQNHAYKSSIEYVVQNRLMWLYGDGNFYPEKPVTQADLIASLVSLQQLQEGVDVPELPQGFWAKVYYERAKAAGMLEGVVIDPTKQLTREEFSQIVANTWGNYRKWYKSDRYQYKVQMVVDSNFLPAKAGTFPNGVATTKYDGITGVTRAEQAVALKTLHQDHVRMAYGDSLFNAFDSSIKISGGYFKATLPAGNGYQIRLLVIMKNGERKSFSSGSINLNISQIEELEFTVVDFKDNTVMSHYNYVNFPNYSKQNSRW